MKHAYGKRNANRYYTNDGFWNVGRAPSLCKRAPINEREKGEPDKSSYVREQHWLAPLIPLVCKTPERRLHTFTI